MKRSPMPPRKAPLRSKVGLRPGGPLKRSTKRMNKVSTRHVEKAKQARERHEDSRGVAFDDVEDILGRDKDRWPKIKRVTHCPKVLQAFHAQHKLCWKSGVSNPQAHHMASGFTRGAPDELCALVALSRRWHEVVNTSELPLGELLWLKWRHDRPNTDWVRLTLLFGYFLPDLIRSKRA